MQEVKWQLLTLYVEAVKVVIVRIAGVSIVKVPDEHVATSDQVVIRRHDTHNSGHEQPVSAC